MNEKLNRHEYVAIAKEVTSKLQILFPQVDSTVIQSILGPEILAKPLRISTRKTKVDFNDSEKRAVTQLRNEIAQEKDKRVRTQKMQQLDHIILFGELLFAHSACGYFFKECERYAYSLKIRDSFNLIQKLIEEEDLVIESSRFEVLSRRKEFDKLVFEIQQQINLCPQENSIDAHKLNENLQKTKLFYYQINDLNFKYAQKPSRSFSTLVNTLQNLGSKIALTATIIALGATALSFIPPFTPIMVPIALAASYLALCVGLPLALKNLGTILYNLFRFGAAPSTGELIGAAFIGTNLITTGLSSVATQLVTLGVTGKWAVQTANCVKGVESLTKTSLGIAGQIGQSLENTEIDRVNEHRLILK